MSRRTGGSPRYIVGRFAACGYPEINAGPLSLTKRSRCGERSTQQHRANKKSWRIKSRVARLRS